MAHSGKPLPSIRPSATKIDIPLVAATRSQSISLSPHHKLRHCDVVRLGNLRRDALRVRRGEERRPIRPVSRQHGCIRSDAIANTMRYCINAMPTSADRPVLSARIASGTARHAPTSRYRSARRPSWRRRPLRGGPTSWPSRRNGRSCGTRKQSAMARRSAEPGKSLPRKSVRRP